MSSTPLVSIIFIFVPGEGRIQDTIERVFAQTYKDWELLVVEDTSHTGRPVLASQFPISDFPKIRHLEHTGPHTSGINASRNVGLQQAKGKYIAFLDQENPWLPDKLERQVTVLDAEPMANMVIGITALSPVAAISPEVNQETSFYKKFQSNVIYKPPILAFHVFPVKPSPAFSLSGLMGRREAIHQLNGFDERFSGLYEVFANSAFLAKILFTQNLFLTRDSWVVPSSDSAIIKLQPIDPVASRQAHWFYTNWLGIQMLEEKITDSGTWKILQEAISTHESENQPRHPLHSRDARQYKWKLKVVGENAASLVFSPTQPDNVRIEIAKAHSGPRYDIQLNLPHLRVQAQSCYRITFRARADHSRTIGVGLAKMEAPWSGLGFYEDIKLEHEWTDFGREFVVISDEENARILFDVGMELPSVEISSVRLESVPNGSLIQPKSFWEYPIDRYRVERFVLGQASDIQGKVLEIGDGFFARQYGRERVDEVVVWQIEQVCAWNCGGDSLSNPMDFFESFHAIILPHVFHIIQDVRKAVHSFFRMLKPGGVLLATFPGIEQIQPEDRCRHWAWTFSPLSVQQLFEEVFWEQHVTTEAFGNIPAVISLIHGLSAGVLRQEELDYYEPGYEVVITVRAVKPSRL